MPDAQMMQLLHIREEQQRKENERAEQLVQDSQNDLVRRTEMASSDPSLNVGGVYGQNKK